MEHSTAGLFPDLRVRADTTELMDLPDSDEHELFRTLAHFTLINRLFSRSRRLTRSILLSHMRRAGLCRCTVLDVGAGGGDFALWLRREGIRIGIDIEVTCLDSDPRVLRYLSSRCATAAGIKVMQATALDLSAIGEFDYTYSNHLLHHLPDQALTRVLQQIDRCSRRGFLLIDLTRSLTAYLGFRLFASLFLRGGFTLEDGCRSIRRAYLPDELRALVGAIPSPDPVRVETIAPGRVFLYCLRQID